MRWFPVVLVACTPAADAAPRDLATCKLAATTFELGDANSSAPSVPTRAGDGFLVAYTRLAGKAFEVVTQRVSAHGVEAAVVHAVRPGGWNTWMAGRGDERVLVAGDTAATVVRLDATGAELAKDKDAMPVWPDSIALGPRGVVETWVANDRRSIARAGAAPIAVPSVSALSIPYEELIASGDRADVALSHTATGVSVSAVAGGATTATTYELVHATGKTWAEVSIAAGHDGFLVARTGPEVDRLELYRLDADGKRAGEPAVVTGKPVARMPRVAALGTGWLVTYWDGVGATLVRVDGAGREIGKRVELRSGDERGGHTDARVAVGHEAIAVTWIVNQALSTHGEAPKRPGPRIALLACSP